MEFPIDLPGGGQMSTQTLCEGLLGDTFETVAVCPTLLRKKASDYPFRVVEYASDENREKSRVLRVLNFLKRIGSFYRIIRREKPDLIHVSMSESLITYGFLRCLGIFARIPFVYTDRGLAYGYRKHSKKCILATLKHAGRLITTTHFNERLWLDSHVQTKITVIPNTIGNVFANYDPTMREKQRKKYGFSDRDLVIGFAGRISEEKDWDFVPVLTGELSAAGVPFRVALVISVYEEQDAQIVKDIRGRIASQIGEENLLYLQDLSQAEMADYYYMVDIFVMSSIFESFGKAAVEAMSRKCVVLSTNAGGLPEVIGREEDLYSKEDTDRFVKRVRTLAASKELLEEEREYFYRRYVENYTLETHLERHAALYREILCGTGADKV
ncbi:MAG: glycosyltransferase family 4 protein [Lachnospiraceae bacterium]|nr:glycosyltransferase family 4 protein [Lachnospiraceae bacterium]